MTLVQRIVLAAILICASARAGAQTVGVRAGVSGSPDQFYGGVHAESGPLIPELRFRPNLEIGTGSNQTLVAVNFEFAYRIPIEREPWSVYLGAGPALNIHRTPVDTTTGGGLNILVGLDHRQGLFTEIKVGVVDSPSVKFAVGYTFRR